MGSKLDMLGEFNAADEKYAAFAAEFPAQTSPSLEFAVRKMLAAGRWVMSANGDNVVDRAGKARVTINQIRAAHALKAAIETGEVAIAGGTEQAA